MAHDDAQPTTDIPSLSETFGMIPRPAARKEPEARHAPGPPPGSSARPPGLPRPTAHPELKKLLVPYASGMVSGLLVAFLFAVVSGAPARPRAEKVAAPTGEDRAVPEGLKALTTQVERLAEQVDHLVARSDGNGNVTAPAAPTVPVDDVSRPSTAPEALARASVEEEEDSALRPGIELFKRGKYQDALGLFDRLQLSMPDDARVWYFAALSRGFATNQWGGGTERLAEKGIEREGVGTPGTARIDAAFRDLTPDQGKEWLAFHRRRVRAK